MNTMYRIFETKLDDLICESTGTFKMIDYGTVMCLLYKLAIDSVEQIIHSVV